MREYTTAGEVPVAADDNVITALWAREQSRPDAPAQAVRQGDRFETISVREFAETVRRLAKGLIALGIEPGSRVGLYCSTRAEFTQLDYAIWAAGCVTVTIYETSSSDQVEWIVGNSDAVAIFCENADRKAAYDEVAANLPECKHAIVVEGGLDELVKAGEAVDDAALEARWRAISHDDLATLVYTSGTTGRPKGCMITHGNFIWDVRQVLTEMPEVFREGDQTLFFLPLAHIFARVVQVGCITRGVVMGYCTGIKELVPEMGMFPPNWVFSVPRVFEKIYNTAQQSAGGGVKGKIFAQASSVAGQYSQAKEQGAVSWWLNAQHGLYDKLVYSKLKHTFGGKLRYAISGGAPLGERLGHFFNGAGVTVLEGYGLTETTAAACVNTPRDIKIGSVGRPIPGASVRIADDGEVLLKGGHIFRGYWKNEDATAGTFDGEWFKTGDVGRTDDDGFLRITGRKKELIITAGGKNVQPAGLEDVIRAGALVSQCVVIGDAKPFVAALVSLDPEELPKWAARKGKTISPGADPVQALRDDPDLKAEVQAAIDEANKTVSKAESIRTFRILDEDLTIEGGELTPTLKVKRTVVNDKYAAVIADIYG